MDISEFLETSLEGIMVMSLSCNLREAYSQMRLVHIQWFLKLPTTWCDEHLIDFELHNEVWKPPTLRSLNTVALARSF
jgi:hypothetical protein